MELVPATVEQIARFKKAAAARYQELGVDPEIADKLFEFKMASVAEDMGLVEPNRTEKLANALAGAMGRERMSKQADLKAWIVKNLGRKALQKYTAQADTGGNRYV